MKLENYFTYKSYPIGTSIHNHPTVKPKELLYNIIKISSNENDIVLDPYI
jgi:DNA modification methylase